VLSTGKWGCGAFGGDVQLKFLIQWMAATMTDKEIIFHTFNDNNCLEKLTDITK
jgi:poly(ADP-ribose) glycohydrolase